MINFTITGDKELMNFFKGMRENVSKGALRAAGRSALGIVVRDARKNIHKETKRKYIKNMMKCLTRQ
jgi:hypothetical protein